MYMYVYICMYTNICILLYVYVRIHLYVYVCMYTSVCICTWTYACIHVFMIVFLYVFVYVFVYVSMYVYTYMYMYIRAAVKINIVDAWYENVGYRVLMLFGGCLSLYTVLFKSTLNRVNMKQKWFHGFRSPSCWALL